MLHLTLAQFSPEVGNKNNNLSKITDYLRDASKQNSDIILFPELSLSGAIIFDCIDEISENLDSTSIQYMKKICNEFGIHAVFTFPEKTNDGEYFNTAALIDDKGQLLGIHRKVHLFDLEKGYYKSGKDFNVFNTRLGKIGISICFDLEFPETARILRLNGAEIILSATNNMEPYQDDQKIYAKSRAKENQIPVAICNRVGSEKELKFFGESIVVDAFGKTIVSLGDQEELITVEVNLNSKIDNKLGYIANRQPSLYDKLIKNIWE